MAHLFFVCVQRKLARSNHYLSAKILLTLQLSFNMIWIHTYVLWLHALKMKLSMASISSPLLLYCRPERRFWNQVGYGLLAGLTYRFYTNSFRPWIVSSAETIRRDMVCGTQRIGKKDPQVAYILTLVFWIMSICLFWPHRLPALVLRNLIGKSEIEGK